MNKAKIVEEVTNLTKPIVEELGYEFVEAKYDEIEGERYISIIIFSENGINFDDCKLVSKAVDEPLDKLNPTNDQSYSLNVSSLGLDRPIKTKRDFERFLNKQIEVLIDGKKIVGLVESVCDDSVKLKVKNVTKTIKLTEDFKAMPYIKF